LGNLVAGFLTIRRSFFAMIASSQRHASIICGERGQWQGRPNPVIL
jgi:hypothetical protein